MIQQFVECKGKGIENGDRERKCRSNTYQQFEAYNYRRVSTNSAINYRNMQRMVSIKWEIGYIFCMLQMDIDKYYRYLLAHAFMYLRSTHSINQIGHERTFN